MRSLDVEVTESARLYGETHVLWMTRPPHLANASPGQFVMVYIGEHTDPLLGRAFSIHRTRDGAAGPEFEALAAEASAESAAAADAAAPDEE